MTKKKHDGNNAEDNASKSSVRIHTEHNSTVSAGHAQSDSQLQEKLDELTADLQRVQADFANYKRREDDAKAELLNYATEKVIVELLPLLDNIQRALAHRPEDLADNEWAKGVEQVGRKASEALKALGVERIEAAGQPFDHNLHEAVSMEDGEGEKEVVIEELQPGYKMGERVIRHAMVKVGKKS